MIGHVASIAIPRMTEPWNVVAAAMAVLGFVYGYIGTAGAPFCGSLGQCVQRVVDAGPPWFYPASLIPGAIAAAVFALFVYLLFLLVHGIRAAYRRPHAARMGQESPAEQWLRAEAPAAHIGPEPTAAERRTLPPAVQAGPRRWSGPTPLLIAIGAALAWAVLSVGPTELVSDLGQLVPQDTVTTPSTLTTPPAGPCDPGPPGGINYCALGTAPPALVVTDPYCANFFDQRQRRLEKDGMCHERSGGTVEPLMDDVVRGGQSGLLAFLAVGAALLLLPRLRAASQPQG
jgi:hypothetical protein